jgi:hypothetical protein
LLRRFLLGLGGGLRWRYLESGRWRDLYFNMRRRLSRFAERRRRAIASSQMPADQQGHVVIERTGVRLLIGDA